MNDLAERQQLLRDIRRVSRDLKTSIPETLPALQIILAQVQAARAVQDTILPSMDRFSSHADEILQLLEDIKLLVSMDPAPEPRTMRTSTEVTAVLACQGAAYVDLHLGGGPSLVFGIIGPTADEKERFDRFDGNLWWILFDPMVLPMIGIGESSYFLDSRVPVAPARRSRPEPQISQ